MGQLGQSSTEKLAQVSNKTVIHVKLVKIHDIHCRKFHKLFSILRNLNTLENKGSHKGLLFKILTEVGKYMDYSKSGRAMPYLDLT